MQLCFAPVDGATVIWKLEGTNILIGKAIGRFMDMNARLGRVFGQGRINLYAQCGIRGAPVRVALQDFDWMADPPDRLMGRMKCLRSPQQGPAADQQMPGSVEYRSPFSASRRSGVRASSGQSLAPSEAALPVFAFLYFGVLGFSGLGGSCALFGVVLTRGPRVGCLGGPGLECLTVAVFVLALHDGISRTLIVAGCCDERG